MQIAPMRAADVEWLRQWMRLGGDMSKPVLELRRLGYSDATIVAALESARPKGNALAGGAMDSLPLIRRAPAGLRRIEQVPFPAYTLDDFLDAAECSALIAMAEPHLKPSILSTSSYDAEFRTSTTANLYEIDDARARAIDEKICRTIGIHSAYGEGIQAQRYEVGQQFKPHYDCYEPGSRNFQRYAGVRGNRTWTFMVYLNDGMEGGATRFTDLGVSVAPRLGRALLWNNLRADGSPNPATVHSGEPVIAGCKVIITKWFRVHGDGPVLDDAVR